jgi:AcrR family transcriptional regulator
VRDSERTPEAREYRMTKRADDVAATRQRIVEAAVRLHGTIGPAATTVSALAEAAGVTRLTVYRHFPDELALFTACRAHWTASQTPPDPAAWARVGDPAARVEAGLADLYRFYRAGEPMLANVLRDPDALPAAIRRQNEARDETLRDLLLEPFALQGEPRRRLRAALGHAVSFWTWRSLCVDNGMSDAEAVAAMTALAVARAAS